MHLATVPFARPADGSLLDWIDHVRQVVRRNGVTVSSFCTRLADALGGWKWPTDPDGHIVPGATKPVHDKHSHPGTALVMGYRTRWRGQLVTIVTKGREAQEDLVVSVSSGRDRRSGAEPRVTRAGLRGRDAAPVGGDEDDDEDEIDALYD